MSQVYFTDEHEWISVEGDLGTVGITDFAQKALGDIVYVELPPLGATVAKGGEGAVVESVKAASEVYSPATGEVTAINAAIEERPGLVNESPEQRGWFYQIRLSNPDELTGLKDRTAYDAFVAALES